VIQVVPLTSTVRGFAAEVTIEPDSANGLGNPSVAQCQHIRAVSIRRVDEATGNVGPAVVGQIRDTLGLILDIPG
jgi:mRNA interferase MazF